MAIEIVFLAASGRAQQDASWPSSSRLRWPTFRSAVELVALNVSVVDAERRFITGLRREDFSVYENGVRRELAFFGPAAVPVDVGLLLDVSASMTDKIGLVAEAATGFIRTLRPSDRATVIGFANRITVLQSFTGDWERLQDAVRQARPGGATGLYNALYIVANEFGRERKTYDEVRRQALVLLSDGQDTSSLVERDEALVAVRRSGVTVYAISPKPRLTANRSAADAAFMLKALAQDTGGRAFFLEELKALTSVYVEIAADIGHQYTLAYELDHRRRDATFRRLTVRVTTRPDARVRTRRGYFPTRDQ
ncbi:MAG: VWA domain-containing protein [Acidobacteria bacterium]|nr:VWA domain-containing protein [Acidobacteriota bacterium]